MTRLELRCEKADLRDWHAKAERSGTTLSALVRRLLTAYDVSAVITPSLLAEAPLESVVAAVSEVAEGDPQDRKAGWCERCKRLKVPSCPACRALTYGGN